MIVRSTEMLHCVFSMPLDIPELKYDTVTKPFGEIQGVRNAQNKPPHCHLKCTLKYYFIGRSERLTNLN